MKVLSYISSLEEVAGSDVLAIGLKHFLQGLAMVFGQDWLKEIHLSLPFTQ